MTTDHDREFVAAVAVAEQDLVFGFYGSFASALRADGTCGRPFRAGRRSGICCLR